MENLKNEIIKAMIKDLKAAGRSYSAIGRATKLNPSTIQKIVSLNRDPRFNTFICILTYYKKIFAKESVRNKTTQNFYLHNQGAIDDLICAATMILSADIGGSNENNFK